MDPNTKEPAIVLLSGGLDSATVLAIAAQDYRLYAMSFRYGQRHEVELLAAERIAQTAGVEDHIIVDIDLRQFGGSALTGDIEVPKGRALDNLDVGIPVTYVPARNTIFLAYALAWAEVLGVKTIFIGVNAVDYSGYPDCRPAFIEAFETMANLATRAGIEDGSALKIKAPLIHLSKSEIITAGTALGVDYSLTISCYDPDPQGRACGQCDSCLLRRKGFADARVPDPTAYQPVS